jgi:hypothetical protein
MIYQTKVIVLEVLEDNNNLYKGIDEYNVLISLNSPPPDFAFTA